MKTLILGGVRSGKSRYAESLAKESGLAVTYIATATRSDAEMTERIETHRLRRPSHWNIIEEPVRLASVLRNHASVKGFILVECLTLWLTNLLINDDSKLLELEKEALLTTLPTLPGRIVLVSNETNMGVTPIGALGRRYCDEAGVLHQELAQICDSVILTVAGIPHILKGGVS